MVVFEAGSQNGRRIEPHHIIIAATAFIIVVVLVAYAVLFHTLSATIANRIFGFSLLIMLLTGFWMYRLRQLTRQAESWQQAADDLDLRCRTIGNPLRMQAVVEGICRGRFIQLSVSRDTPTRLPVTCVDMDLACSTDVKFGIWGPFNEEQLAEARRQRKYHKAKRYGTDKSYLVVSNSPHLSANLFPPHIWQRLQRIDHQISISLVEQTLSFEQPGISYDSRELIAYVELLNEIAYVVTEWEMQWRQQQAPTDVPVIQFA